MALLGGLVHVFNILETKRLKKYTVYTLQMISFPKNEKFFNSLTKLTVIKRYSDFKSLENSLLSTYKGYNLKQFFKSDSNFFNRFDPEVIEQRKRTILEFLYYCAEHSILYRSQHFVKFFDGSSMYDTETISIDASQNSAAESPEESINSIEEDENETVEEGVESIEQRDTNIDYYLCGYLYDAALNFSQAVQDEANLRYKSAFELYKSGIDKLLTGAKNDNNEMRKHIAKTKASRYLEKAEQLYENYILEQQENEVLIEDIDSKEAQSIASLERPLNHMSRYRVIQVNGRIMKVQDRTDKKIYILKVIWKSNSQKSLLMTKNIPFMCSLLHYFISENAIFLLLPFISGGLLWDYVQNYSDTLSCSQRNLEELFVDPPKAINNECVVEDKSSIAEVQQEELPNSSICNVPAVNSSNIKVENEFPSFDTLNPNIDLDDLMKCSKQLLKSVTKTLEKSVILVPSEVEENISTVLDLEPGINANNQDSIYSRLESDTKQITNKSWRGSRKTNVPEFVLKRWASEIIIAINSLHSNGIILGDLNLDNILLGSNGHILLTYFHRNSRSNFQQLCELNQKAIKCQYVAFEFPLTKKSDFYSIGIILYEIFTKTRFYTLHPSGLSKYNEIQYPESCELSDEAKDLLDVLIFQRFIHDSPFGTIKAHSFFEGVNFEDIVTSG